MIASPPATQRDLLRREELQGLLDRVPGLHEVAAVGLGIPPEQVGRLPAVVVAPAAVVVGACDRRGDTDGCRW